MNTFKGNWSSFLLIKGKIYLLTGVVICLVISAALGYFIPITMNEVYRSYGEGQLYYEKLFFLMAIMVGIYVNRVLYGIQVNKYIQYLIKYIRGMCYTKWILNYEMLWEGKDRESKKSEYPLGEILSRIMNDTESIRELITSGALGIFIDVFLLLSCFVSFFNFDSRMGSGLILIQVLVCLVLIWGSRYMARVYLKVRKSTGLMSRAMADVSAGMRQIYYTDADHYSLKRGKQGFNDFLRKQLSANNWDASYYSLAESLFPLFLILIVILIPYTGVREAALIAVVVDLIQRSIDPIKNLTGKVSSVQRAYSGLLRMREFLIHLNQGHSSSLVHEIYSMDFQKILIDVEYFEYQSKREVIEEGDLDEHFCLENIHFSGKRGELIGLVGLSGSGKSTLLKIMSGAILPSRATITLKASQDSVTLGHDIVFPGKSSEDISRYREQVGLVSQDSHIFTESLYFNISLSHQETETFKLFWDHFCENLPYLKKWAVKSSDIIRPEEISLGQKQLISALRACYLKKPVVLFDEISSGLDIDLEKALRKMVLLIQQQSLTLIVAHRIETITKANKIIVLHDGTLKDEGTHDQLMTKSPIYQRFINQIQSLR